MKIATISSRKLSDTYEGNAKNNYLYNDKELFDDGDLNWYDYGFRNYDPQIGRFTQLDPLTFKYPFLSPYQYASDDPIDNIDIDGLEGGAITGGLQEGGAVYQAVKAGTEAAEHGGIVKEMGNVIVKSATKSKIAIKSTKILSTSQKMNLAIKASNTLNTPITTISQKNIITTTITNCHGASLPGWSLNVPQGSFGWRAWFKEGWLDGNDNSQTAGSALKGEGKEYSAGPGTHADYFDQVEQADMLIDMLGNGAGPERGVFSKMFDRNFSSSERVESYFEFIKEYTENVKLIRNYMEKFKDSQTGGDKKDKAANANSSLDSVFLKKGNTVYHRGWGITVLMTDGKGGGIPTNKPARDTFPRKKIPPDYMHPYNK